MRVLPSIPAAVVTGAVVLPLFMRGMDLLAATLNSEPFSLNAA